MNRLDLAFSFSQLSKFLQYPGDAHLAAAYRVLAYVKGTLNQGLSYHDPGVGKGNKKSGWVDSDFLLQSPSELYRWIMFISITTG
jgi:hypothetical protein